MIEFTKGDMFDRAVDIRVNTVNCKGVMGAGVALAFKTRYPDMYDEYRAACNAGKLRPGALHVWKNLVGDWIINFPTKRHWRENSRYEDIEAGLDALFSYLKDKGNVEVALPALGCGNGKLDWSRVSPMIQQKLGDLEARIYVFEPADSLRAAEITAADVTDETMRRLEAFGYSPFDLPSHMLGNKVPLSALVKGVTSPLLDVAWIALLPSSQPGDREIAALQAIAREIVQRPLRLSVALVRTNRASDVIAKIFAESGVKVVLIHPFIHLPPVVPSGIEEESERNITHISLGGTSQKWSKALAAAAQELLHRGARGVLLSDPAPNWLTETLIEHWNSRALHFVHYGTDGSEGTQQLRKRGIRAIGRKAGTGEPNLDLLVAGVRNDQPRGFAHATAAQLRELAEALERAGEPGAGVFISIDDSMYDEMRIELQRILPELV